jgi:phage/plasmid-like protein (TIGR03299 family)
MAHEVEDMMYVGQAPWHGLGKHFIQPPSLQEAIEAANLNWEVGLKTLITSDTKETVEAKATYRKSDGSILGVVGPTYHPLQNSEAFKFFEPFIDTKEASIETAGSLRQGKRVFVMCKINRDPLQITKNDIVEKYILLSNSHDGTLAVRVGFSPVRVVCSNTLSMAHNDKASSLLKVRHTKGLVKTLDEVRGIMNLANQEFEATAEQYKILASKNIDAKTLEKYVKLVFNPKAVQEKSLESINSQVLNNIIPLFEKGRGNDMLGTKGTFWAAYNAINEYLQYERSEGPEASMDQMWFGISGQMNKKALEIGLSLAA